MNYKNPGLEITIAGGRGEPGTEQMLKAYNENYLPFSTIVLNDGKTAAELAPSLKGKVKIGGKATAYVCRNFSCSAPTDDAEEFSKLIVS